jgi:pectate lyase
VQGSGEAAAATVDLGNAMTSMLRVGLVVLGLLGLGLVDGRADNLSLVDATLGSLVSHAPPKCPRGEHPGLRVEGGKVTAATLLDEIEGYAKVAGVKGGLGGELATVTNAEDYDPRHHEQPIPGSLRWTVEEAARRHVPMWIVFDLGSAGPSVIHLKTAVRPPDNVTLDGQCSDVVLESTSDQGLVAIFDRRNIIVSRLAFHKSDYVSGRPNSEVQSAIRLNGNFDAIAILHNDLSECGDGCIDITVSPGKPLPTQARATVAFNLIHDHDKTMLFGTFTCPFDNGHRCDQATIARNRDLAPALFLTLQGNLFLRTGQRHPRAFGRSMLHEVNNVVAFKPQSRPGRPPGDSYGVFVSNGARALIEDNLFIPLGERQPRAVWIGGSPSAARMVGDLEGYVRLRDNAVAGRAELSDHLPDKVPQPTYQLSTVDLAGMTPEKALACIAARAGRSGGPTFNHTICR